MTRDHDQDRGLAPATILARAGRDVPPPEGNGGPDSGPESPEPEPLVEPVTLASVYRFRGLDQLNEVWDGRQVGHVYRRFSHPNQDSLERLVRKLEGAEEALACSSGMGAIVAALTAHLRHGDAVLGQEGLYGGTQALLAEQLERFGVTARYVPEPTPAAFRQALDEARAEGLRVKVLIVETVANPSLRVAEVPGLVRLAAANGLVLMIDNTFATPLGCRPMRLGPCLVVHSTTKFMNGHSDVIGGVVAGPRNLVRPVREVAMALGLTMAPLDAWLTLRGMKTLHLRFARQQENAAGIARWLSERPEVSRVLYPGLPSHPSYRTARDVLEGPGAMVSFELAGGEPAVARFLSRLRLVAFSPSLGESETTVTYPALTSHRSLAADEKARAGATPGLIRLSAGTEHLDDILADLEQAMG